MPNQTYGASQSITANVLTCKHGTTVVAVGWAPPICPQCADEAWAAWFDGFEQRYELKHGSRFPIHGYDEADLREAFERRD